MVWGCISDEGIVDLLWLEGKINADVFISRIEKYQFLSEGGCFQHDNAPAYRATKVSAWFEEHKIKKFIWPPQSPDLSPIENVWGWIKHQIWINKSRIKTKDDLWNLVQNEWFSEIVQDLIKNSYESLPTRVKEVIKKEGGPTKY